MFSFTRIYMGCHNQVSDSRVYLLKASTKADKAGFQFPQNSMGKWHNYSHLKQQMTPSSLPQLGKRQVNMPNFATLTLP